jgi:hypothetical protein
LNEALGKQTHSERHSNYAGNSNGPICVDLELSRCSLRPSISCVSLFRCMLSRKIFVSLQRQLTNLLTPQNTYSRRFSLLEHSQQQEIIAGCFVNSDQKWSHARRCSHSLAYPRMSGWPQHSPLDLPKPSHASLRNLLLLVPVMAAPQVSDRNSHW